MMLPYTTRHLATSLVLGLLVAAPGCGGEPETPQAEAEPAPKPEPEPAPEPEPTPEPEPVAKALPKTLPTMEAAIEAAVEIHSQHRETFYCGCGYTPQLRVARGTCGYKTRADETLSKRVAWDRVVPNRAFGQHRACWREPLCKDESGAAFSGVRCCREIDEEFRTMEHDLHNLVPAVGEIQADRSDFDFGEIDKEERMYGACDFEVDLGLQRAEPDPETRGDIARIYLYMHQTYGDGLPLTPVEKAQFEAWHDEDPPSAWEVQRNRRIAALQGTSNDLLPMMAPGGDAPEPEAAEEAPAQDAATVAKAEPAAAKGEPKAKEDPAAKAEPAAEEEPKAKEEPEAKEEPAKEEPAKAEPAKAEPAKAEPTKEEPAPEDQSAG